MNSLVTARFAIGLGVVYFGLAPVWLGLGLGSYAPQALAQSGGPVEGGGKQLGNWLPGTKPPKPDDPNQRTVTGVVKTANDDLAVGAVVQLKDTKSLQVRSFITKADGTFLFGGLSKSSDYVVKAEAKGMVSAPRNVSSFDDRKRVNLTLRLDQPKESPKDGEAKK